MSTKRPPDITYLYLPSSTFKGHFPGEPG